MLKVHPLFSVLLQDQGLNDMDAIMDRFVPAKFSRKGGVLVRQDSISNADEKVDVYFKLYFFKRPSWRFLGRPSKAAMEFRNYGILKKLGIFCADPIACGEERDIIGRLKRAFIITKTVPESVTLEEFLRPARKHQPTPVQRRQLLEQVANSTRRIHEATFFHHDLVWRNILVTPTSTGSWQTSWIDCPRGGFVSWKIRRRRSQLRDLGSFDKSAARQCNRSDRLRAFLSYMKVEKLDASSKALIQQVREYCRARWPDDWPF